MAALLLILVDSDYFDFDFELIDRAGRARSMAELNEEIRDHVRDPRSRNWWRKVGLIRISSGKLSKLAKPHLDPQV